MTETEIQTNSEIKSSLKSQYENSKKKEKKVKVSTVEMDLATGHSSCSSCTTDNALGSSIEYLNLCTDKPTKKSDIFFNLFSSNSNSGCVHQRKTVTIMEPNGHKVYPIKSIKKEKTNDGNKRIMECHLSRKTFLDVSLSSLNGFSRNISKLNHLTQLYIYGNKISKLPKEIGNLVNLKELWMQENNIDFLPSEMKYCQRLRHLDVRHNHLGDECLVVLKNLQQLEILLMNNNKLTRIDGIGRLKKLENLSVKANKLEGTITNSIKKLHNLMTLDLSKNRISNIPEGVGNCTNLRRLSLEYNRLKELPVSIGRLEKLDVLGLKYNRLESLPFSLSNCIKLKELNVENNILTDLPKDIYNHLHSAAKLTISHNNFHALPKGSADQYSKTEKLNAEYNNITVLNEALSLAKNLRVLNLACNFITELKDADISGLCSLMELNLSFNHLKELPTNLEVLTNLETLDLTNNNIRILPPVIGKLISLKNLNLESNRIVEFPIEFSNLIEMKTVNASSNQIKHFPDSLIKLKNLEFLNLSENLLECLPYNISSLARLTHLFLKDNKHLNDLPLSLIHMKRLSFLSLNGCPLKEIPSEYSKSSIAVMAYLRALDIGRRLKEMIEDDDKKSDEEEEEDNNDDDESESNKNESSSSHSKITTKSAETVLMDSDPADLLSSDFEHVMAVDPKQPVSNLIRAELLMKLESRRGSAPGRLNIPSDIARKMKTTDAGFMAI